MKKNYVLDSCVLLNDPDAIFKFGDSNVILPLTVIEEVDKFKKPRRPEEQELARAARQVARNLKGLRELGRLDEGVALPQGGILKVILALSQTLLRLPLDLSDDIEDNRILSVAIDYKATLVSNDTNMCIKAEAVGLCAEEYQANSVKVDDFYTGTGKGYITGDDLEAIYDGKPLNASGVTLVDSEKPLPNQCFTLHSMDNHKQTALARYDGVMKEYKLLPSDLKTLGLTPKNAEQQHALNLLLDPDIKLVSMIGKAGSGKAQPLDAEVLTPSGYVKMGSIELDDTVITPSGDLAKVIGIFPQGTKDIYSVTFSDGASTECCEDHLWEVHNIHTRDYKKDTFVTTTKELRKDVIRYFKHGPKKNYSIPLVNQCLDFMNEEQINIDPYLLGVLLGDGTFRNSLRLATADEFIVNECVKLLEPMACTLTYDSNYDYRIVGITRGKNALKTELDRLGLFGLYSQEKFVPTEYLYNTFDNRLRLLQGLMDTDGFVSNDGVATEFYSTSSSLADAVQFLVESMGGLVTRCIKNTHYTDAVGNKIEGLPCHRLYLKLPPGVNPFRLPRKADRYVPKTKYKPTRFITSIDYVGKKEAQCILIDHPQHLYITNNFIVTHNTLLALAAGLHGVLESKLYSKVLLLKPIVAMDNSHQLGYLPGTMDMKLGPWLSSYYDNIDFIMGTPQFDEAPVEKVRAKARSNKGKAKDKYDSYEDWEDKSSAKISAAEELISLGLLELGSLEHIRGRSLPNQFIIVDEAQGLTQNAIKTIITRSGEGTKIVILGDIEQIDLPYLSADNNGLVYVADKFKDQQIAGHITLTRSVRSELAEIAATIL